MSYDNSNSGVLFNNDKKDSDRHPDYTGSWTDADGNEFWLSAWVQESKAGRKFISLKATAKEPKPNKQYDDDSTRHRREPAGFDNDLPF